MQKDDEERRRKRGLWWLVLLAVLGVVAATGWFYVNRGSTDTPAASGDGSSVASASPAAATDSASPTVSPTTTPTPTNAPKPKKPAVTPCVPTTEPFTPARISMPGVTSGSPVLALPRDANGVVGVPPISTEGKLEFAWDAPGIKPGSAAGTAIFNAHTWPDGTALGNHMLDALQVGSTFRVYDAAGAAHCYTVSERQEVAAETAAEDISPPVYTSEGPPALVFIVCSGVRRGPGDWSARTLFWATPDAA